MVIHEHNHFDIRNVGGILLEKLVIKGGNQLNGRVRVSSAKNAVLPIIAATLLASTPSKLLEIPNLEDVGTISQVIESLGVKITRNEADDEIIFDASMLTATEAPYELVRKMRASFLVMGPLLARKGKLRFPCLVVVLLVRALSIYI